MGNKGAVAKVPDENERAEVRLAVEEFAEQLTAAHGEAVLVVYTGRCDLCGEVYDLELLAAGSYELELTRCAGCLEVEPIEPEKPRWWEMGG